MKTDTLVTPAPLRAPNGRAATSDDDYFRLVRRFPLRKLRSDAEYDQALEVIDQIMRRPQEEIGEGEAAYAGALAVLLEAREREGCEVGRRRTSPARMITHLMEERGMTEAELDDLLGRPSGAMLAEEEEVGEADARKLSDHFGVSAVLFT